MKKKLLWAVAALLALTVTVLIAAWPHYLPVERMRGELPPDESFEEMVKRAEQIVLSDVKAVKQGPDYASPIIGTDSVYREPTQRITLEVVKVYKGDVAQGQRVTLFQGSVGVTRSIQGYPWPVFRINENDPVYKRGEQYILMLSPVPISEEVKPYQPEPWQEGMFSVIYPGRMRLNADGAVTSVLDTFGTNGKTLEEIEARIAAATTAPSYPATYNGLPLPTPRPVAGFAGPPPVWLIVGDQAIPPSLAAGGTERVHGDPPFAMPDIATVTLLSDENAVIVVASESFTEFKATVRAWREDGAIVPLFDDTARELNAEIQQQGNLTVFTLEPTGDPGDQLLNVYLTFPADNAWGFYLWRLNPAQIPTLTADQAATATSSQSDLAQAREALLAYFSLLHAGRYAEAVNYYGGSYDLLREWNPALDPNDYAALFEHGCRINGLMCLEVRTIVQEETVSSNEFKFVVEFTNDDGSPFVRGPCCGASETDMPPQSQFSYTVKKVDGRFLVQGLPVAVP